MSKRDDFKGILEKSKEIVKIPFVFLSMDSDLFFSLWCMKRGLKRLGNSFIEYKCCLVSFEKNYEKFIQVQFFIISQYFCLMYVVGDCLFVSQLSRPE